MKLKKNVKVQGITNEILLAIVVAQSIYRAHGEELVITSLLDGRHSRNSLHYSGAAVDLRTRDLAVPGAMVGADLKDALGADYDVVVEATHIHVEYQPKR